MAEDTIYVPGRYLYRCMYLEMIEDEEEPSKYCIVNLLHPVVYIIKWLFLLYNVFQIVVSSILVPFGLDFLGMNPSYDDNIFAATIKVLRYLNYANALSSFEGDSIKNLRKTGYKDTIQNMISTFVRRFFYLNWICNILILAGDHHLHEPFSHPSFSYLLSFKTPVIALVGILSGYYSASGHRMMDPLLIPANTKTKVRLLVVDILTNWIVFIVIPIFNVLLVFSLIPMLIFCCCSCCRDCGKNWKRLEGCMNIQGAITLWLAGIGIPMPSSPENVLIAVRTESQNVNM